MLYLGLHCIRAWHGEQSHISCLIKSVLKAFCRCGPSTVSQDAGTSGVGAVGGEDAGLAPQPARTLPGAACTGPAPAASPVLAP